MENGVKQRVIDLAEIKCESISAFTKAINVGQSTMSEYINRGKKPSGVIIAAILKQFPDVSAEWLLRGEGDVYKKVDELPFVDVNSEESIQNSAEMAKITRKYNELVEYSDMQADKIAKLESLVKEQEEELKRYKAQLDFAADMLRSQMLQDQSLKVG